MNSDSRVEIALSAAVIVIAVLAIAYFIYAGGGILFYLLFLVAVALMVYMWRRTSPAHPTMAPATVRAPAQPRQRKARKKRQRR